jgi:hypothetical protein
VNDRICRLLEFSSHTTNDIKGRRKGQAKLQSAIDYCNQSRRDTQYLIDSSNSRLNTTEKMIESWTGN